MGKYVIVPRTATEKQHNDGHVSGVQADALWQRLDHRRALELRVTYLPAAYPAMLKAAPPVEWTDEDVDAAIKAGCSAADLHLACGWPDCSCEHIPKAARAVLDLIAKRLGTGE